MKTDVIVISSNGNEIEKALEQTEKVASYKELSKKDANNLRLLAEEMMGMMRAITGEREGMFWIEDEDDVYELHLRVTTLMTQDKREELIKASKSGKNEAARSLMGRLIELFDHGVDVQSSSMFYSSIISECNSPMQDTLAWTLSAYHNNLMQNIDKNEEARELWDELEKSVVAHLADDVKVYVRSNVAEMTIIKKLG